MGARHIYLNRKFLLSGTALAVLFCAGPVYAQQAGQSQIETVTVTAQRTTQKLQDVPMSVQAITLQQMQIQGIQSGQDLNAMVPNLSVGSDSAPNISATVTIRGIPEVGLYIDGIWQPDVGFREAGIVETQRVEILRGPQGTLFGRNTNGGAINYITVPPADKFGVNGSFEVGSYGRRYVDVSLDVPLTDTLLTKWTASIHHQGGWLHSITNQQWYGGSDDKVFRGDVLWKPTNSFSLRVTANQTDSSNSTARGADFVSVNPSTINTGWTTLYNVAMMNPKYGPYTFWNGNSTEWLPRFNRIGGEWSKQYDSSFNPGGRVGRWQTVNNDPPNSNRISESEYTATIHWNINPHFQITNLASYLEQDTRYLTNFFGGPVTGITDLRLWRYQYYTEELHVEGDIFGGKVHYLLGAYWLHTRQRQREYRWSATEFWNPSDPNNPIVTANNYPVFDQTLYNFLSSWITNQPWNSPYVPNIESNFSLWDFANNRLKFHDFELGGQPRSASDYSNMLTDNTVDDRSVFANATWHVLPNLDVQGGVRFAWQTGTNKWELPKGAYRTFLTPAWGGGYGPGPLFEGGTVEQVQKPYTKGVVITPMATASYHFTPDVMVFVRYAQGYTAGSTQYNAALAENITLTPEVVHDYEAGFRSEWFDHRLQANLTGYYMEWDGRPVQTSYFIKTGPNAGNFVFATTSGGKSRADGFEFTLLAVPMEGLKLQASGALLTTRWITFGSANVTPTTPWAYSPKWTFHLAAQYDFIIPSNQSDVTLRADWGYIGNYQLDGEIERQTPGGQPAYGILNTRIQYTPSNANWNVQLFATNLTDSHYISAGYNDASVWGEAFTVLGQRRMWGLRVAFNF